MSRVTQASLPPGREDPTPRWVRTARTIARGLGWVVAELALDEAAKGAMLFGSLVAIGGVIGLFTASVPPSLLAVVVGCVGVAVPMRAMHRHWPTWQQWAVSLAFIVIEIAAVGLLVTSG